MATRQTGPGKTPSTGPDHEKLDRIVAQARQGREARMQDYREQSLRIHPWVCARCGREFTRENLQELTVHHKDHNHDNNPPDGSNWENLCVYCHENEHARQVDHRLAAGRSVGGKDDAPSTHRPFEELKALLDKQKR